VYLLVLSKVSSFEVNFSSSLVPMTKERTSSSQKPISSLIESGTFAGYEPGHVK